MIDFPDLPDSPGGSDAELAIGLVRALGSVFSDVSKHAVEEAEKHAEALKAIKQITANRDIVIEYIVQEAAKERLVIEALVNQLETASNGHDPAQLASVIEALLALVGSNHLLKKADEFSRRKFDDIGFTIGRRTP